LRGWWNARSRWPTDDAMRALICLLFLTTPALADDYISFVSPSGNISCALFTGDIAGARCDMRELTPSFPTPPDDCELDWGNSFLVNADGPAVPICYGDTVASPDAVVLDYGKSISLGGFTCTSAKTGMACVASSGHGFHLSKARQTVF
jgi:hypothetical protein